MKSAGRWLLSLAAIAMALIAWWAIDLFITASRAAKDDAQRVLMIEASKQLATYFEKRGEYPDSLDSLRLAYPGGESTLATLRYKSDGKTYSITTESAYDGSTLEVDSDRKGELHIADAQPGSR